MRLSIDAAILRDACARAVSEKRTAHPILEHAHLWARSGNFLFTTTDTQKWREESLPASVEEQGEATCDVVRLKAVLSGISGQVELATMHGGNPLLVKLPKKRSYKIESLPPAEFPDWPAEKAETIEGIDAGQFMAAVATISYAIDPNDARRYLHGLGLGNGWATGTDGKRAAFVPFDGKLPDKGLHLPKDSLAQLAQVCAAADGEPVEFSLFTTDTGIPTGLRIRAGGVAVSTRLLDDQFPLEQALAFQRQLGAYPVKLTFNAEELLGALDRLRPFCLSPTGKFSTAIFTYISGDLILEDGKEDASDKVDATFESSGDFAGKVTGALNPEYLRQTLAHAKGGMVTMQWSPDGQFFGFTFDKQPGTHCLMQVRL